MPALSICAYSIYTDGGTCGEGHVSEQSCLPARKSSYPASMHGVTPRGVWQAWQVDYGEYEAQGASLPDSHDPGKNYRRRISIVVIVFVAVPLRQGIYINCRPRIGPIGRRACEHRFPYTAGCASIPRAGICGAGSRKN